MHFQQPVTVLGGKQAGENDCVLEAVHDNAARAKMKNCHRRVVGQTLTSFSVLRGLHQSINQPPFIRKALNYFQRRLKGLCTIRRKPTVWPCFLAAQSE